MQESTLQGPMGDLDRSDIGRPPADILENVQLVILSLLIRGKRYNCGCGQDFWWNFVNRNDVPVPGNLPDIVFCGG